jgi:hypothetical protein
VRERRSYRHAAYETTDVRPEGNAAGRLGTEGAEAGHQLEGEPEDEEEHCRDLHHLEE